MQHTSVSPRQIPGGATVLKDIAAKIEEISGQLLDLTSESPDEALITAQSTEPFDHAGAVSLEEVRAHIKERRLRTRFLPADLFSDPAWDMLLKLYLAEIAQERVPVGSCATAGAPMTTGLRWIKLLSDQGLIVRQSDPLDARRFYIKLSPLASKAMWSYFLSIATDRAGGA